MEEPKKDVKDIPTLIFVIFLIIAGIIGCCLLFIKPKKTSDTKKEQRVNQTISLNQINDLKTITGIKDNSVLNELLNSLANIEFSNVDDNTILNMFIYSAQKIEEVDSSLCTVGPNSETCNKYLKQDFISFLKNYDFNNNFDYLINNDEEYIYLKQDVITTQNYTHTINTAFGYKDNKSMDYITLSDNLYSSTIIGEKEYKSFERYNYIFKKSGNSNKSNYYLIKVEKADYNEE